jgi:hypothetical protein
LSLLIFLSTPPRFEACALLETMELFTVIIGVLEVEGILDTTPNPFVMPNCDCKILLCPDDCTEDLLQDRGGALLFTTIGVLVVEVEHEGVLLQDAVVVLELLLVDTVDFNKVAVVVFLEAVIVIVPLLVVGTVTFPPDKLGLVLDGGADVDL